MTSDNDNKPTPEETPEVAGTENATDQGASQGEAAGQAEAANLELEVASLKDRLLRTMADMENLRKRAERDRQDAGKFAIASFARDLLAVSDNLRRALDSVKGEELSDSAKTFYEGVDLTERELLRIFEKVGIRKISPLGEKFDHNFHEAMFEAPSPDHPAGTVIQVVEPGYVIHDRLLRPARVGVSKALPTEQKVDTRV